MISDYTTTSEVDNNMNDINFLDSLIKATENGIQEGLRKSIIEGMTPARNASDIDNIIFKIETIERDLHGLQMKVLSLKEHLKGSLYYNVYADE